MDDIFGIHRITFYQSIMKHILNEIQKIPEVQFS